MKFPCRTIAVLLTCTTSTAFLAPKRKSGGRAFLTGSVYKKQQARLSQQNLSKKPPPQDEEEEDGVFYDDFDFVIGGESSSEESLQQEQQQQPSILTERIQEFQKEEIRKDAQLAKNWKCGNWKVRGFSLDKYDPTTTTTNDDNDETNTALPIQISHVAMDPTSLDRIAVARTDGSVCLITLGTEYLAKFTSKLTASSKDEFSVEIGSKLVRDDEMDISQQQQQQEDDEEEPSLPPQDTTPFDITHQFVAHADSPITALLIENDIMYTAAEGSSEIKVWTVPEDPDEQAIQQLILTDGHDGGHVNSINLLSLNDDSHGAIQKEADLLLSTASDGSFAVWDGQKGDLVFKHQVTDDDGNDVSILCADVNKGVLYLGLSSGHVVGYVLKEILSKEQKGDEPFSVEASCRFLAYEQDGVSAIQCTGDGTLGRSRPGAQSSILLTGGTDGVVKQWELLSRTIQDEDDSSETRTKLEHWPRLANQRMQKRAHLFKGHDQGAITALACVDPSKFLSAGVDGTVRAWSPTTGKELFLLDGFVDGGVSSLCLNHDTLITNGMDSYVCVHDFDVTESEVEDGYEMEW